METVCTSYKVDLGNLTRKEIDGQELEKDIR